MNKKSVNPVKLITMIAMLVFAALSIYIAVTNSKPEEDAVVEQNDVITQYVTLNINQCDLLVDTYGNGAVYDTVTLSTDKPNPIIASDFSGYKLYINDTEILPGGAVSIELPSMSLSDKITLRVVEEKSGAERVNYINTIPPSFNNMQIISDNPEAGYYYFNLDGYVYKMSTDGRLVYWRMAGGADASLGGNDFKRTEVDGKVYYSFLWGGDSTEYPYLSGVKYGRMQALVLDENYQFVDHIQFMLSSEKIGANCRLANVQFSVLGDHHYLLTAYVGKNVDNIPSSVPHTEQGVRVTAAIVQEIKDGQLVFEWDSTDYPELYALNSAADYYNKSEYWTDYIHLNSVAVDPADNNLVLSLSNADTIIKIDRTSGKILWKLGGLADEFGLSDEQKFSHQNDVRITSDGAITMFNNGVPKVTVDENGQTVFGQSTIIKLRINEASKTLVSFEEYACDGAYSPDMGSAQELSDGRYVVGWGERYTATPLFSEIDFKSGKTLFALVRPNYNGSNLYRVYKCQS